MRNKILIAAIVVVIIVASVFFWTDMKRIDNEVTPQVEADTSTEKKNTKTQTEDTREGSSIMQSGGDVVIEIPEGMEQGGE